MIDRDYADDPTKDEIAEAQVLSSPKGDKKIVDSIWVWKAYKKLGGQPYAASFYNKQRTRDEKRDAKLLCDIVNALEEESHNQADEFIARRAWR